MKRILSRALALFLLPALLLPLFSSCGEEKPDDGTSAPADITTDAPETGAGERLAELGGFSFSLPEGAAEEDGVLSSSGAGSAYCAELYSTGELSLTLRYKKGLTGSVGFRAADPENYYHLSFSRARQTVTLAQVKKGVPSLLRSVPCRIGEAGELKVKIALSGALCKIFVYDNPNDPDPFPKFDLTISALARSGVLLDFGSGETSFSDLVLADYSYKPEAGSFYINPIAQNCADPYILCYDGKYYLYGTNNVNAGYNVSVSTDLVHWENKGMCLREADVYGEHTSSAGFWAPEVYHYDGKFYLVYTVGGHLGVAVADSPLGPFKNDATSYLFSYKTIDGHLLFDDDGKVYLFFVRTDSGNVIYAVPFDMKTLRPVGTPTKLIAPQDGAWDTREGRVNEGPFVLKHNGIYYLTYSGNGYTSQNYAVGYATASSPLGPYTRYSGNPILKLSAINNCYGPGHHAFFVAANGEPMIVYHRHRSADSIHPRDCCIDRYRFVKVEGEPYDVLVIGGPTSTVQKLPQ